MQCKAMKADGGDGAATRFRCMDSGRRLRVRFEVSEDGLGVYRFNPEEGEGREHEEQPRVRVRFPSDGARGEVRVVGRSALEELMGCEYATEPVFLTERLLRNYALWGYGTSPFALMLADQGARLTSGTSI